jgi:hypothetical protein
MEIPKHWRLKQQRYALMGEICNHCEAKLFPPRAVCPECGGETGISFRFSGKGKTYSYTNIRNGEQAPTTEAELIQVRAVTGN